MTAAMKKRYTENKVGRVARRGRKNYRRNEIMKFYKKLLAVVLATVLALSMLTACGGGTPLTQPDIEKGKEIAAALNEIRAKLGEDEVAFDKEYSVKLTEYANAYTNWQYAMRAYDQNSTTANKNALDAAKQKYDTVSKNLPEGVSSADIRKENVANYEYAKANGGNYFADRNGTHYPLATVKGDMCAVTVITKEDLTFAIILVGTKSTK